MLQPSGEHASLGYMLQFDGSHHKDCQVGGGKHSAISHTARFHREYQRLWNSSATLCGQCGGGGHCSLPWHRRISGNFI